MLCSDGNFYVVKFRNNPQHVRVLANEMLATRLAEAAGLPVPITEVVEVGDWLLQQCSDLDDPACRECDPVPARVELWLALRGRSAAGAGIRLLSSRNAGAGA